MASNRIIKVCSIAGFILAEIYMVFIVLAPNVAGAPLLSRMIIPKEEIPKSDVPLGTPPPTSVKITRLLVVGFFLGPFGAMAGLGVGLLVTAVTPQRKPLTQMLPVVFDLLGLACGIAAYGIIQYPPRPNSFFVLALITSGLAVFFSIRSVRLFWNDRTPRINYIVAVCALCIAILSSAVAISVPIASEVSKRKTMERIRVRMEELKNQKE